MQKRCYCGKRTNHDWGPYRGIWSEKDKELQRIRQRLQDVLHGSGNSSKIQEARVQLLQACPCLETGGNIYMIIPAFMKV